jgi:DNA polymerase elongation subunit (family B)
LSVRLVLSSSAVFSKSPSTSVSPPEVLSEAQRDRRESEIDRLRDKHPDGTDEDLSRRVGSFHPHLGWICCISAVRGGPEEIGEPKSWTAASREEESRLLDQFWADVHVIGRHHDKNGKQLRWVTFNGKQFDVPFLTARTVASGLAPTRKDITNTYPYDHEPHADLMGPWPSSSYSLEGLCSFLGAETPKGEVDGSMVAKMTRERGLEEVAEYCEGDAVATLRCAQEASVLL